MIQSKFKSPVLGGKAAGAAWAFMTLVAVALCACGGSSGDAPAVPLSKPAALSAERVVDSDGYTGTKYFHELTVDSMRREFIVYVPASAGPNPPVVFMLHGTSGDGPQFFNISGWRQKADAEGLIAVFPTAMVHCFYEDENGDGVFEEPDPPDAYGPNHEKKVTTKWAHGELGRPDAMPLCTRTQIDALGFSRKKARLLPRREPADDLAFFDAMIDFLAANYAIDTRRVHVTGFSAGGQMATRLGVERSQRFAAAATNSGPSKPTAVAARPISMSFAVGNIDDRFVCPPAPLQAAHGCIDELPVDESAMDIVALHDFVVSYLAALRIADVYTYSEGWGECTASGCTVHASPAQCVVRDDCRKIAKFSYTQSTVGADNRFEVSVIKGLGHSYPNGKNHPLVAAQFLWDNFFRNKSLP